VLRHARAGPGGVGEKASTSKSKRKGTRRTNMAAALSGHGPERKAAAEAEESHGQMGDSEDDYVLSSLNMHERSEDLPN